MDSDGEVRLELGTCSFHFSPRIGRRLLIGLGSWFSWLYRFLLLSLLCSLVFSKLEKVVGMVLYVGSLYKTTRLNLSRNPLFSLYMTL